MPDSAKVPSEPAPERQPEVTGDILWDFVVDAKRRFVLTVRESIAAGSLDPTDDRTFARIIATARDVCGLDQNELARVLEVSHGSMSRWVNEKSLPRPPSRGALIFRLCDSIVPPTPKEVPQVTDEKNALVVGGTDLATPVTESFALGR